MEQDNLNLTLLVLQRPRANFKPEKFNEPPKGGFLLPGEKVWRQIHSAD